MEVVIADVDNDRQDDTVDLPIVVDDNLKVVVVFGIAINVVVQMDTLNLNVLNL